jgi:orotidine-5'-phosphate decarboxylase
MVDWIVKRGHSVMLDLKFFDVPQTVALAVSQLEDRGITYATIHGNNAIMEAAAQAKRDVKILAVTVLTSLDEGDLRDLGFQCSPLELVLSRARRALELGCDGVVSSGLEAPILRNELGEKLLVIVPGVRPVSNRTDDQKRIVTVREAFLNGADHVVIGRPISRAENPTRVVEDLRKDIEDALRQQG